MKRLLVLFVVVFSLFGLFACSPVPEAVTFRSGMEQGIGLAEDAPQIPEALIQFFNGVVIALFTAGFIWVFEKSGLDLRQYAIPLAGTLSTWVVVELQGYINTIPNLGDTYFWINLLFRVLLALIPAAGILRIFSRQPATLLEVSARDFRGK